MELHYVTTNNGKFQSLQRALAESDVQLVQSAIDIPEPRSSDVQEIAAVKLDYAYKQLNKPVVVLDAGFYIPSLNGFPRAFVNFALETVGLEGILKLVEGKDRSCEFRECLGYNDGQTAYYFVGRVVGTLAETPRGEMQKHLWSKLGLIFVQDGSTKTHAEMTHEEYVQRKLQGTSASRQFAEWLKKTE